MISLRKAENFIFSLTNSFLASLSLIPCSFSSSCPPLSFGLTRASIDLDLRTFPSVFEPLVIVRVLGRHSWTGLCVANLFLAEPLLEPFISNKGAVSQSSSKYPRFSEISVQDWEYQGFLKAHLTLHSLLVLEFTLEEEAEEEEEKKEEKDDEDEEEEEYEKAEQAAVDNVAWQGLGLGCSKRN